MNFEMVWFGKKVVGIEVDVEGILGLDGHSVRCAVSDLMAATMSRATVEPSSPEKFSGAIEQLLHQIKDRSYIVYPKDMMRAIGRVEDCLKEVAPKKEIPAAVPAGNSFPRTVTLVVPIGQGKPEVRECQVGWNHKVYNRGVVYFSVTETPQKGLSIPMTSTGLDKYADIYPSRIYEANKELFDGLNREVRDNNAEQSTSPCGVQVPAPPFLQGKENSR